MRNGSADQREAAFPGVVFTAPVAFPYRWPREPVPSWNVAQVLECFARTGARVAGRDKPGVPTGGGMQKKPLVAVVAVLALLAFLGYKYFQLARWVNGLVRPAARALPRKAPKK